MIRATGLGKRFGTRPVLSGIDLAVAQGERVALLGLNGAGKTTFIRCLLGLLPFEGSLSVAGHDVRHAGREARAQIGYVPQRAPHFDGPLAELLGFLARLRDADYVRVAERLSAFGLSLDDHGDKPARALSGGMLQKVLLALALGERTPLLVLDEPTANLDAHARRDFLRALAAVDADTTILLSSHRLEDIEAVADRLVVLHGGRIAFDGRTSTLTGELHAASTLWVRVPPDRRADAHALLRARFGSSPSMANGSAVGIGVGGDLRADVLIALRTAGIPVDDFWVESPALHDVLDRVLQGGTILEGSTA